MNFNYDIDWMNDILCVWDLRMHEKKKKRIIEDIVFEVVIFIIRISILFELWLQFSAHSFLYYIFIHYTLLYIIRVI